MFLAAVVIANMALTPAVPVSVPTPLCTSLLKNGLILAADPHGPDPHGDDPHDEIHDANLKSNADQKASKAPTDPYGGQVPK